MGMNDAEGGLFAAGKFKVFVLRNLGKIKILLRVSVFYLFVLILVCQMF